MHRDPSPLIRAALWIMPTGEARESIVRVMRLLRERTDGPAFHPHLTLLQGMETTQADAELKLRHLAARLKPFMVRLGRIGAQRDYFRCLYAAAAMNGELAAAYKAAHEVFQMNPPEPFDPHVSLLYGNLDEVVQKALVREAGGSLHLSFEADALHLVNAAPGVPVAEWKTLAERRVALPATG